MFPIEFSLLLTIVCLLLVYVEWSPLRLLLWPSFYDFSGDALFFDFLISVKPDGSRLGGFSRWAFEFLTVNGCVFFLFSPDKFFVDLSGFIIFPQIKHASPPLLTFLPPAGCC